MAGRRRGRNRTRSLAAILRSTNTVPFAPVEQGAESDLPAEVLELILSRLCLHDNVRSSSVCKKWYAAAISVRKANRPPLLLTAPKSSGDYYGFYDPSDRKTYFLRYPKLTNSVICYANFGWLLLYKARTKRIFFFHLYTQDVLKLPKLQVSFMPTVAFSAPPTSPSCVLFSLTQHNNLIFEVCTCRPGDTEWTRITYANELQVTTGIWNSTVFRNGLFYCLSMTGWLAIYDPGENTLNLYLNLLLPQSLKNKKLNCNPHNLWKQKYLAEHNGEIYAVFTCPAWSTVVCKLDEDKIEWVEMPNIGNAAVFASYRSTQFVEDLLGNMRNQVYFSRVHFYGSRCIHYSLRDRRYYPRKNCFELGDEDFIKDVWVDPPEDFSIFL